jgi:hypothetical protein
MALLNTHPLRDRLLAKGGMLAQFLNVADGLPKQKKVLRLLECCCDLDQLLPGVIDGRPFGHVAGKSTLVYDLGDNKKASRLLEEINRLLKPYRFRRSVAQYLLVDQDGTPSIQTHTAVVRPVPFSRRELGSTIELTGAVELLLDLAEQGALDRVRLCPMAGKRTDKTAQHKCRGWFMADRTDQKYCTASCGRKNYRQTHKEVLRAQMKKYRKNQRAEERQYDKFQKEHYAKK